MACMSRCILVSTEQLNALSHKPQRRLLLELLRHNPQKDQYPGQTDREVEGEELELLLDFQHYHLPKLEEKGYIKYDREQNIVTKGPDFKKIEPLIELLDEHRDELPEGWP